MAPASSAKSKKVASARTKARGTKKLVKKKAGSSKLRLWGKRAAVTVVLICALPFLLTLVYALPFVKPVSTLMIYQFTTGTDVKREWVDIEDIAKPLQYAVVMSEDGQFCSHYGVDLGALRDQVEKAIEGEATRGASTISMQTVKNLFLWHGRSYFRKVIEMPLAVFADLVWSKRRMLEIYLNIAELGDGVFGIELATQTRFKRSAAKLDYRRGALIATTLPSPLKRNAAKPSRRHRAHARIIEKRAKQAGAYVGCLQSD